MASVMFSSLGAALGGPFGGVLGAVAGGIVDGAIGGRSRPPVPDPLAQRSSYGAIIPRLFGTVRVGGHLIWSAPMRAAGRKGSGQRAGAMNLAFAVSSGPIQGIGRIWADGRLFRTAEGAFADRVVMRVHDGWGRGDADPLIVAAEGADRAPAHARLAHVVLEGMNLGDFGNRIPLMSFEVFADDGPLEGWLEASGGWGVAPESGGAADRTLTGYVAGAGEPGRDAEALAAWAGMRLSHGQGCRQWRAQSGAQAAARLEPAAPEEPGGMAVRISRRIAGRIGSAEVSHLDPARDYQAGLQRLERRDGEAHVRLEGAYVASAEQARRVAGALVAARDGIEGAELRVGFAGLAIDVGQVVEVAGEPGRWRVERREIAGLAPSLKLARLGGDGPAGIGADGGRAPGAILIPPGPTVLMAIEPAWEEGTAEPGVWLLAAGNAGWRGADLVEQRGAETIEIGRQVAGRAWGRLAAPLEAGPVGISDERHALVIDVETGGFETRTGRDWLDGANLIAVGGELLRFRDAVWETATRVRLTGLLRGQHGTPAKAVAAGGIVMSAAGPARAAAGLGMIGSDLVAIAHGRGDPPGGTAGRFVREGRAHAPLPPAHLRVLRRADGAVVSRWVWRSRDALAWDGPEPAPGPVVWSFEGDGGETFAAVVAGATSLVVPLAEQVARLGGPFPAGLVRVVAMGPGALEARAGPPVRV